MGAQRYRPTRQPIREVLARRAASNRARERARKVLKPGDRLRVRGCGGTIATVTMTGWDNQFPNWITSATRDDISPLNIVKVNGVPTSFADPAGFVPPAIGFHEMLAERIRRARSQLLHWRALNLPTFNRSPARFDYDTLEEAGVCYSMNWPQFGTISISCVAHDEVPF